MSGDYSRTLTDKLKVFADMGTCPPVTEEEMGYLQHCVEKAKRNTGDGTIDIAGHPLFVLWMMDGLGEWVQPFLIAAAKQHEGGEAECLSC